ncbi:hypothetical protein J0X14_14240 [Muricauda sp. CAU 1633]|uniref:hypothetical protein n=1 Tax=Allomuricauda sp. CAU 1633 TaxID=2816036 RepID=UPI001A8D23EA|nr:hypothetical protein [Muricauda sp. CAU 1633]MBO0323464.1 hypothetical protein [Muricauda sp. CAU 1633]
MIQFEDIVSGLVNGLDPISGFNDGIERQPRSYWGTQDDLPRFLKEFKENGTPLAWCVSKPDTRTLDGYVRDAEIAFCTRETRELLNTDRMEKAYKVVLIPFWEAFESASNLSQNIVIEKGSEVFEKFPNYSVDGKKSNAAQEIWDVYKVSFTARFYENNNC